MKEKIKKFILVFIRTTILLLSLFLLYRPARYNNGKLYLTIVVCTLVWAEYVIMVLKEKKINRLLPLIVVYICIVAITTAISNYGNINYALWNEGLLVLSTVMLFAIGFHYDSSYFLLVFYFYCVAIIVWGFFALPNPFWTYPMGIQAKNAYVNYGLLNPNVVIVYLLPALFSGYILLRKKYFSGVFAVILYCLVYAICLFFTIYFDSKNAMISLIIWGVLLLVGQWVPFEKVLRPIVAIVFNILVCLGATVIYDPDNPGFIGTLLSFLNRHATFGGRTPLWKEARTWIASHPFLGAGSSGSYKNIVFSYATHAHNIFLNALVKAGVFGAAVLLAGLLEICHALRMIEDRKIKWAAVLFFFTFLLNLQFDVYYIGYLCGSAALLYFVCVCEAPKEKREKLFWHFPKSNKLSISK